jgi:hypothetical protein
MLTRGRVGLIQVLGTDNMIVAFHAEFVAVEDPDESCFVVGFTDAPYETQQYLLLQRAFEHDEQDIELGQNTYYVELCSQAQSGYGGISRCDLYRDRMELEFSGDAVAELGGITDTRITFHLSEIDFAVLHQRLSDIFRGSDCYSRVGA